MKIDWLQYYQRAKTPLGLSIILHIVVLLAIILASVQQHKVYQVTIRSAQASQPTKIVQASVVSQAAYQRQQQVQKRRQQQKVARQRAIAHQAELRREKRRQQAIAQRKAVLKKQAQQRAAKQAALKKQEKRKRQARQRAEQKKRQLAQKRRQKQRQKQKRLGEQRAIQKKQLAKKRRAQQLAKQRSIADKLKQQALNSLGQQITADQKAQQAAQAQQQKWLTEREKYIGLIQQTIRGNWINQFSQSDQLTVVLSITLNLQGQVESVQVLQSSGSSAFDRQAILAVRKSSPLPMPKDKALAKQFEHIKLPFSNTA